jgi:hypothetical protein
VHGFVSKLNLGTEDRQGAKNNQINRKNILEYFTTVSASYKTYFLVDLPARSPPNFTEWRKRSGCVSWFAALKIYCIFPFRPHRQLAQEEGVNIHFSMKIWMKNELGGATRGKKNNHTAVVAGTFQGQSGCETS